MEEKVFYKIVHLDIGRKYFRLSCILRMIDRMAECGYNQLQLAFGNDGFRLLLDDMAVDNQSSDEVTAKVRAGNRAYNGDESCLTQREMDAVIDYAGKKGIEIVPMLNVPGHMTAALFINPSYRWTSEGKTSVNSLDVGREDAVAFGMELLEKYASYFASRGCRYFHFGADEYGNDIYAAGGLGFARLEQEQRYGDYVSFLNRAARVLIKTGMIPRAFNDGFYYHGHTEVTIQPEIQVCYWGNGWCGFDCASAAVIGQKGHALINSSGDWYYVLTHEGEVKKPTGHTREGKPDFNSFRADGFPGGQTYRNADGAMFCIWCDHSALLGDMEVVADAEGEISAMYEQVMKR